MLVVVPISLMSTNCAIFEASSKIKFERTLSLDTQFFYYMEYNQDYYFDDFIRQGGAKTDQDMKNFLSQKMFNGNKLPTQEIPFGCTSFNYSDSNGKNYHARNYDMYRDANCAGVIKTNPKNGYKSLSNVDFCYFGNYGYNRISQTFNDPLLDKKYEWWKAAPYFALDGINEKGLAISVNQLYDDPSVNQTDHGQMYDLTTTTMLRNVLDHCDSVDSAIDLLRSVNLHDSISGRYHYQISDVSGKSVVVEYDYQHNDSLVILYPQDLKSDNDKFIANENFTLHKVNWSETDWESSWPTDRSRFDTVYTTLLETGGVINHKLDALDLLAQAKQKATIWSTIFSLDDLTMTLRYYDERSKLDFDIYDYIYYVK